jgi:Ca2+-dependent lipid-binding protein
MEIRLRVIEARNLPALDTFGLSDPYCKIQIKGSSHVEKTAVVKDTKAPRWDTSYVIEVPSYGTDVLKIQMYDEDVGLDEKMGKLNIQASKLPPGKLVDTWYPLTPTKRCPNPGEIHIAIQIAVKGAPEGPNLPYQPLILRVTVVEAKGLAKMDTLGNSDCYCVVNLVNTPTVFKTAVQNDTLTPTWNETTEFAVTNPLFDILHVLIRDKDISSDDDMATVQVPLAKFGDLRANDAWYSLTPIKGVDKGGQIRLTIQLFVAPIQQYDTKCPGVVVKSPTKQ